jgi:hypothetical protein
MSAPFLHIPHAKLSDPVFRRGLLNKLGDLIAILEVTHFQVSQRAGKGAKDSFRLKRTQHDVARLLDVCRRTQMELKTWKTKTGPVSGMTYREYLEVISFAEYEKLSTLGPILSDELSEVDVEDLCYRLTAPRSAS